MKKQLSIILTAMLVVGLCACTKVTSDHAINDTWEYVSFKYSDGTLELYGGDTTVSIEIASSNMVTGIGPQAPYEGDAEIWKDGAIQIGALCCANITAGDSTYWKQVQFFNRLTSSSKFELFSNTLVLKNSDNGGELRFIKQ
jgi:hypothetical protein